MSHSNLPYILETTELQKQLGQPGLLIIGVVSEQTFVSGHVPGSHLIQPAELTCGIKPATGKLPEPDQLARLFSRVGLKPQTHVVAYDDEGGGWAGRLLWTLDVLGHQSCALLNGGLTAWIADGLPLESGASKDTASEYKVKINTAPRAQLADVMAQLDNPASVVWDARAAEEYRGDKQTAERNGHIPGARNLDWLELMDRDNGLRLKPLSEIRQRLETLGITPDKSVITHCQTHHRSGLTYVVGKALGYDIQAYDGSWSEWGNHPDTPIER